MACPRVTGQPVFQPELEPRRSRFFLPGPGRIYYDPRARPSRLSLATVHQSLGSPLRQQCTRDPQTHRPTTQGSRFHLNRVHCCWREPALRWRAEADYTEAALIGESKSTPNKLNPPSQSTRNLFIKHLLTINYSPAIKCY